LQLLNQLAQAAGHRVFIDPAYDADTTDAGH